MKNFIFILLLLQSLTSFAGISVISDLDDTIKITNSGDDADAARRGLFSDEVFTGMPELMKAFRSYVSEVHVLSASPTLLRPKIERTLRKKGIEVNSITLKNPFERQSTPAYKLAQLRRLLEENAGDDFILLGDDVDKDPEIYEALSREYPNRILASYIHVVRNRPLPKSSVKYWTSYDLFLREFQAGRMLEAEVTSAGELLTKELRMNLIFPGFADCPKTPGVWLWQLGTRFAKDAGVLMAKFNVYCTATRSGIAAAQ